MVEVKGAVISSQAPTTKRENDAKVMNHRRFDKVRFNRRRLQNHKSLIVTSSHSRAGACTNTRPEDRSAEMVRSSSTPDMRSDVEVQDCIMMNESHDGVMGMFAAPPPPAPEDEPWTGVKDFVQKAIYGTPTGHADDDDASSGDASDSSSFPSLCQASPIGRSTSILDATSVSSDWTYTTADSLSSTPNLPYTPNSLLQRAETYTDDEQEQELLPPLNTETRKNASKSGIESLTSESFKERSLVLCYEKSKEMITSSLQLRSSDNKLRPALLQCQSRTSSQSTYNNNAAPRGFPTFTGKGMTTTRERVGGQSSWSANELLAAK